VDRHRDHGGPGDAPTPLATAAVPSEFPYREAALALLLSGAELTQKAAQFCGGLTRQQTPLTPAQAEWLDRLLQRAALPPLAESVEQ
jgi:hypothetical protein